MIYFWFISTFIFLLYMFCAAFILAIWLWFSFLLSFLLLSFLLFVFQFYSSSVCPGIWHMLLSTWSHVVDVFFILILHSLFITACFFVLFFARSLELDYGNLKILSCIYACGVMTHLCICWEGWHSGIFGTGYWCHWYRLCVGFWIGY